MSTNLTTPVSLTTILPSPYVLVYAIPLLLVSVTLTFAGAFLTVDRTRSFPPSADVMGESSSSRKTLYRLEGGVGGLGGGWVFGVHLTTYLSLIIMNHTSAAPLGPIPFLLVWLLPAILFTLLTGRVRLLTFALFAISGGASFAILLVFIFHPELSSRLILLAVFVVLFLILTVIPVPRLQRATLRTSCSLTGAFGTVVSISLLGNVSQWQNAWEVLSVDNVDNWVGSAEKGLAAALCLMALFGAACDWMLKKQFGENPDEKWDSFLSSYASNLPTDARRAGTFQPLTSWWDGLFSREPERPLLFPTDSELKAGPNPPPQLPRSRKTPHKAALVKFKPFGQDDFDSSSDDSDDDGGHKMTNLRKGTSLSGTTLHSSDKKDRLSYDEDDELTTPPPPPSLNLRRSSSPVSPSSAWKPAFLQRKPTGDIEKGYSTPPVPGSVPATPSLIKAINRVAEARNAALGGAIPVSVPPLYGAIPEGEEGKEEWKEFWDEVKAKASR